MAAVSQEMNKHYHLLGIGGIGMSGIAQLLLRRGIKVSGSDLKETTVTRDLEKKGARIFIGHDAANIAGADVVVYSSAVKEGNPELAAAKNKAIPVIKRAEALAELMSDKSVITVAGSHGKTTVTSLVSYLLLEAGFFPTVAIGGILKNIDTNAYFGDGRFFVAEADESDASFLYYRPKYSIVTNIDYEHLDYYRDFQSEIEAFREFLNNTETGGCLFYCSDDANLRNILRGYKNRYIPFGMNKGAHVYPKDIVIHGLSSEFDCFYKDKFVERFQLSLGGMHNISNSLAAIALGLELGIGLDVIKRALSGYKGTVRRMEVKYNDRGYLVIDDYAHHPTEISATLSAVRNLNADRIIAVFQPHRYSRTKLLLEDFGKCFDLSDYTIITDIYPAGELPLPGVNGVCLKEKIQQRLPHKEVYFLPKEEIVERLMKIVRPGDLVVTLGAGDIVKTGEEFVERLRQG